MKLFNVCANKLSLSLSLNLFFCKRWRLFFEVQQRWVPFFLDFQGLCLDI